MVRLSTQKNRIIDANFNRLREALKTVEDIIRFALGNQKLLSLLRKELKKIRKVIIKKEKEYLPFREIKTDIGKKYEYDQPYLKKDLIDLLFANLKRAEESCRTLEEIFKINKEERLAQFFKEKRFFLYQLEKELNSNLKKELDLRVYPIIDLKILKLKKKGDYGILALKLIKNGATVLQLRAEKDFKTKEFIEIGKIIKEKIKKKKVKLIINDRVDVCLAINADGVHLGKDDMPVRLVREILGKEKIIGKTIRNIKELKKAEREGVDYCACGAIFPSQTKKEAKVVGIKTLKEIIKKSRVPIVAIGGINLTNVKEVLKEKPAGVAFISAIKDIKKMAKIIKWVLKDSS
uniref:Thiamine-phosphate synthase n=1 Tax=candidate division WOR-3 bacterium TaxID=2052148 RepID=A0A7V3ZV02_UNCW3